MSESNKDGLRLPKHQVANKAVRDEMFVYFSCFGRVRNIEIFQNATQLSGHITFARSEKAVKALEVEFHKIGVHNLRISAADSEFRVKFFSYATAKQLLDLSDDSLKKIFSKLSVMSLCSIARTSSHLNKLAKETFSDHYKSCNLMSLVRTVDDARKVLITFGSLISELQVGGSKFDEEELACIFKIIRRCCVDTLESLILHDIVVHKDLMVELKPLLNKLQKIHIDCLIIKGANSALLDNCDALIKLKITLPFYGVTKLQWKNTHPKLEKFHYNGEYNSSVKDFLSRHINLKSLSFSRCRSFLIPIIADKCRNLEILKFDFPRNSDEFEDVLKSLFSLQHLRKLKFDFNGKNVTKFIRELKSLKSLQSLELWNVQADSDFTSALTQLHRLQVLRLHFCSGLQNINGLDFTHLTELSIFSLENIDVDVSLLVEHLKNLKILKFRSSTFILDMQMYLKIVDIVRRRSLDIDTQQNLQMTCHTADDLQCDKNNRKIVRIFKRI